MAQKRKITKAGSSKRTVKTNTKNVNMSRSNKRSAQEMNEWYQKNKHIIDTYKKAKDAVSDILQIQNPTKNSTKSFSTFSKENLRTYLENPLSNAKNLRNLSKYLYYRSQVYRRLIQYNANMINLDYRAVVPPYDIMGENDKESILQSYSDTLNLLEKMNLNLAFKPACITAFREDVFFGCAYIDDTGFFILPIDPDYCKISGVHESDGSLAYWMDMSYFMRNSDYLEYWGEPFQSMYAEYQKDTANGKYQPMPEEYSVCLKVDLTDWQNPVPPYIGLFDSLINLEDLKNITAIADEQDIYKMLVATVPLLSGSDDVDDFAVDLNTASVYFNLLKESLPNYTTALLSPIPIESIEFNGDQTSDVNKVENATKAVLNTSGGAQVLNSSSISGTTAWTGAIRSDEEMALSSLLPQIQTIMNRLISNQLSNPSRIKFIGITRYTVDTFRDNVIKASTYGVPNKLLIGTLNGFSELDTLSMINLENDILELPKKFIPLQSSNTQDTSKIASEMDAEEASGTITDSGEESIDKRDKAKG